MSCASEDEEEEGEDDKDDDDDDGDSDEAGGSKELVSKYSELDSEYRDMSMPPPLEVALRIIASSTCGSRRSG